MTATHYKTISLSLGALLLSLSGLLHAGSPVWTFTPLTNTTVTVASSETATIQYTVTNQSMRSHTLEMTRIPGISQTTTAGNCGNPFTLGYQESCTLTLVVTGSALQGNVSGGPKVCQQGNALQCYQPSSSDSLNITLSGATPLAIGDSFGGGTVACLTSTGGEANLIAATEDNSAGTQWAGVITPIPGAGSDTDGYTNTEAILAALTVAQAPAAGLCATYESDGFTDWFLPAKDQLNCLYQNKDAVGGFVTGPTPIYWSSTEVTNAPAEGLAWLQNFFLGTQGEGAKGNANSVRCVRAFTP